MADSTVYFATNRTATGDTDPAQAFGADPGPAGALTYGRAHVTGTDLADENSGIIVGVDALCAQQFDAATAAEIDRAGRNLLIFIHGFANRFSDAIKRSAFNRVWMGSGGVTAADTTVIAYTWPSLGEVFGPGPLFPKLEYFRDQGVAGASGAAIAAFLATMRPRLAAVRARGQRVFLLVHSMGNWALQAGVDAWFAAGEEAEKLFDEIVLAAADEIFDSFAGLGRFARLPGLAQRVSIYHSTGDLVLQTSNIVNDHQRLGFDGPADKTDPRKFPPANFRIVDCQKITDYNFLAAVDATHQYYRRSPRVRGDIATLMAGNPQQAGGLITL
jgi:esterase/lipase superfamily enzyme